MPYAHSISITNLTFSWPTGQVLFNNLSCNFGQGRTGIVGDNGSGKSTLLKLIAGELPATSGTISATGRTHYLRQRLDDQTPIASARDTTSDINAKTVRAATTSRAPTTVADLLGIRDILTAIDSIASGSTNQADFDAVGDDWDVEARAMAELASAGITVGALDRAANTLSGGEAMTVAIVGAKLVAAEITLLDEPTNNLDRYWRQRVYNLVSAWRGTLVIVSHDTELLELVDNIAELRQGTLTNYGGNFSHYQDAVATAQRAAVRNLQSAEKQQSIAQQKRIDAEQKIAHSQRQGRKDTANSRYVKAVTNMRINSAERSRGTRRDTLDHKLTAAAAQVDRASRLIRDDDHISIELSNPELSATRRIAELVDATGRRHVIAGPERIGLVGRNGVGKSTLLAQLVHEQQPEHGQELEHCQQPGHGQASTHQVRAQAFVSNIGYLAQSLDGLDEDLSVLENVKAHAQTETDAKLKDQLARLLLRGEMISRPVRTLSGGERFRVAIARILLATPPAQLLVLDEPTNNLDLSTTEHLIEILASYRGALIIVSHDHNFLAKLSLDAMYELKPGGRLTRVS